MCISSLKQGIVLSLILSILILECWSEEKSAKGNTAKEKIDRNAAGMILYCSFEGKGSNLHIVTNIICNFSFWFYFFAGHGVSSSI